MKRELSMKSMRKPILFMAGLFFLLAFAQCKKEKQDEPSQKELIQITDESIESINERIGGQAASLQGLEPVEFLVKLSEWLTTFEGIVSATPYGMDSISVVFADGTRGDVSVFDETIEEVVESNATPFDFENLNHKDVLDNVIVSNREVLYWAPEELDFDPILDGRTEALKHYYARGFNVTVMNDDLCTVASLRELTQYGTVLINSHGLIDKILTAEEVTINKNREYRYELDNDMIGRTWKVHLKPDGHYSLNPLVYTVKSKFIENLEGSFESSLVFVAACYSKHRRSRLCQAFLNKGASAYFGFTDRAMTSYCFDGLFIFSLMMVHYETNTGALYDEIKAAPDLKSRKYKNGGRSWEVFLEMEGDENVSYYEEGPMPQVITEPVEIITTTSALLKGKIVTGKGSHVVFERGFCYGDTPLQYYGNSESEIVVCEGPETSDYSYEVTGLYSHKQYYVKAYAITVSGELCYGEELNFNTLNSGGGTPEYVDLGLPSGTLWAICNVGAETPDEYGDYFAWGETQPKDYYDWSTYQYCNGSAYTLTKYCNNSDYGYNGFTDNLTTLLPEDDAATANWGSDWRMPTKEEWQELLSNTTVTWTTQNGVNGRLFTASNGNSLFLPAAGYRWGGELDYAGSGGYYWSSSLYTDNPGYAWDLGFYSGLPDVNYYGCRNYGFSVRPVLEN